MADEISTRPIPTNGISEDGAITASTATSTEDYKIGASVPLPPEKVVPIIFVPGIMGSNLKAINDVPGTNIKKDDAVWRPPNGTISGLGQVVAWDGRDPATRQQMFDPDNTEVDDRGAIHLTGSTKETLTEAEAKRRGWGTVHLDSYGAFLNFIDASMNQVFKPRKDLKTPLEPNDVWKNLIDPKDKIDAPYMLTQDEIKRLGDYHFPVYAVGYNWLQSNKTSGLALSKKIGEIKEEWASHGFKKVIIISHSMGGLVTRSCAKKDGTSILGVVHGVCPSIGTPLAYRRIACGAEKGTPNKGAINNFFTERPVATIMGSNASRTTGVMGFSPGALELLPNHLYAKKWLIGEVPDKNGTIGTTISLPNGDPYTTIYQNKNAWYRLVNPNFLDPAGRKGDSSTDPSAIDAAWDKYIDQLSKAEAFHKELNDFYFNPTYVFHGDDDNHLAFSTVRWQARAEGPMPTESQLYGASIIDDAGEGEREINVQVINPGLSTDNSAFPLTFKVAPQDGPGDGTVSKESGESPKGKPGVRMTVGMTGFDHQGSYNNDHARNMVLYSVCKLIQEAE